jgi:hypothetical protein
MPEHQQFLSSRWFGQPKPNFKTLVNARLDVYILYPIISSQSVEAATMSTMAETWDSDEGAAQFLHSFGIPTRSSKSICTKDGLEAPIPGLLPLSSTVPLS